MWHHGDVSPTILVLTAVAALAVLAGVALTVLGRGGQLARFEADHPPLDLPDDRPVTGPDVSRVVLPLALWGYHVRAVDEVLRRVVAALAERDARIHDLEQRLAAAGAGPRVLFPRGAHAAPIAGGAYVLGAGAPAERPSSGDGPEWGEPADGAAATTPDLPAVDGTEADGTDADGDDTVAGVSAAADGDPAQDGPTAPGPTDPERDPGTAPADDPDPDGEWALHGRADPPRSTGGDDS